MEVIDDNGGFGWEDYASTENYDNYDFSKWNFTESTVIWGRKPAWEVVIKSIAVFPIMTVGIVGNIAVICFILSIKSLRASHINLFILNMSFADLLTTLICPWVALVKSVYQNYELGPTMCKIEPVQMLCLLASVLSLITISIDRLIAIVYPFKRHLNRKASLVIIVIVWVLAVALTSPLFSWRLYRQRQWNDYLEKWCTETNVPIAQDYWLFLMLPLVYIPLLVMVGVYWVIIRRMDRYEKTVADTETPIRLKHRRTIIKMLFIYIITIIICWLPLQICVYYRRFKMTTSRMPPWYINVCFISSLFATANSAVNPIVTFRKSFSHLVPKLFRTSKKASNRITPMDVVIIREHLNGQHPSLNSDSTQKQIRLFNISNGLQTNTTSFTKQIMMKRAPEIFLRKDT